MCKRRKEICNADCVSSSVELAAQRKDHLKCAYDMSIQKITVTIPTPIGGQRKFQRGQVFKSQVFLKKYKAKLEFQEGLVGSG